MADFLQYLRQQNIFGPRPPFGNDLPSQGGITGRMPLPPGPNTNMNIFGAADPTQAMPPPMFDASSDYLTNANQPPMFGGPAGMDITKSPTFGDYAPREPLPEPPGMDAGQRMRELYTPQTEATERFNQMIQQYPQEDKPSWLRRIGAMIVDYTKGSKRAEEWFHEPYNEKVQEWKDKIAPAQQAANLERYENVNQRTLAANQIAAELREKAQQAKEKNDERNAQIRQQRADVYQFKATHPNWKVLLPKGGNVTMINPITNETHDTGIPTGTMTDLDRIWLQGEQRIEQIEATGAQARETEGVRQTGRIEAITERGKQARETKATPPGGATGVGGTPTQMKVNQYNKAREIYNSSPALGRYIKLGAGNEFRIMKPGEKGGPTPQEYSTIINSIYGATTQGSGGRGSMAGPGPGQPMVNPPPAPTGWKYVAKPGGGWTAVPDTGVK